MNCGATDKLTAHHWCVCDHHAHAARYCTDNGVTLCYACHIRGVHTRADWVTVSCLSNLAVRATAASTGDSSGLSFADIVDRIMEQARTEVTTDWLRRAFAKMQARVIDFPDVCGASRALYGKDGVIKKLFMNIRLSEHKQLAVAGNTVHVSGYVPAFSVSVATLKPEAIRYTLIPIM